MANTIGIDFGTTKTMVSYFNPASGRVELVRLGRDRDSIPTTVYVDNSGSLLFGDDADDMIETDPEGYVRAFKLELGNSEPLVRGNLSAEKLAAEFLKQIKRECELSVFHDKVEGATITTPVSFSPARKAALKRAAQVAGFSSVAFLSEPEAAGTAFLRDNPNEKFSRALILDWGGGTVDISILEKRPDGTIHADSRCAEGRDDMGGEEIDRCLLDSIVALWGVTDGGRDEIAEVRFLREAKKLKERLSKKESVSFRRGTKKHDFTREQFNHIIRSLLDEAVRLVSSALGKNAAQGKPEPDALILIGGSCQIPAVREAMEKNFPKLRVLSWHHSHEAVALGATWNENRQVYSDGPFAIDEVTDKRASMPIEQRRYRKTESELAAYISERKVEHEDYWYFIRSMIVALWRLNPVLSSALALGEEIGKIAENEDSKIITLRIRQGLGAIALGKFDEIVESTADSIEEFAKDCFRYDEVYVELYPGLKAMSAESESSDKDIYRIQGLKKGVSRQLRQLQDIYDDICRKYNMLCDGYARYDKIIAGSSFWKNAILGGALGWLTGGIGVIAAVAWGGWNDMNNKDFVQNYANAVQDFLSICDTFTDRGQELLSQMVMSMQDLWGHAFAREEAYLRALNAEGVDLAEVERQVDEKDKQEFQNTQNAVEINQMVALALQLLRQDAPISENRIQKIVGKLRRCGALLTADGAIDETALQALIPVNKRAEDSEAEFWKIVRSGEGCDEFYIGNNCIPQNKLINALRDYAVGLQPENVLCLFDSTFFGGGGDGFVIAPGGMCWKQLGCNPQTCTWDDMKTISASDRSENGSTVSINGIEIDVPRGHVRTFENMFCALRDLLA